MSQPQPLTIAQIKELPVGSPVPVVVGTLVSVYDYKTNIGRNDSTCQSAILKDTNGDEIRINIWNQGDYKSRKGADVRIVAAFDKGKCSTHVIENKHYNPPAIELQLSKATVILVSGANTPAPTKQTPQEPKESAAPSEAQADGAATHPPKTDGPQPPPAARGPRPVNGQTVGNAMKLAIDIVMKAFEEYSEEATKLHDYIEMPEFSIKVHQVASDLIRIAQRLEKGYLAPTVRERYKAAMEELGGEPPPPAEPPPPPPPQEERKAPSKAKPGPDGQAFDPGANEDEDVPF